MNEIVVVLLSGLSIGLIGSIHCVGMCGPLALSLPVHHLPGFQKTVAISLYNIGRAVSYASMGIIFGLLGQGFALFKIQQWLSGVAGLFILVILLNNQFGNPNINALSRFTQSIKVKLGHYLKSEKSLFSYFTIGAVNGFLPCGLVYVAIAAALATGTILKSSLLMFAFGIGTLPLMALTMVFGKFIPSGIRMKINKMIPHLTMAIAVLLILRGLNLGIPLVSPAHHPGGSDPNPPAVIHCH